jgi:putative chitinase
MPELTPTMLAQMMGCPQARADECFPNLVNACQVFGITDPASLCCFLTQVHEESAGLVYFAELAAGDGSDGQANYNGRLDLGNTQAGDGPRFKGAGPIQVTGRSNFQAAQDALTAAGINIDIIANPDLARTVQYGFWISCWWWSTHNGNQVAQRQPLSYASLCCGRLVNRGDADSPYAAQGEDARIAGFQIVSSFGDLTLPGSLPTTGIPAGPSIPTPPVAPPVPEGLFMSLTPEEEQEVLKGARIVNGNLGPFWPGQATFSGSMRQLNAANVNGHNAVVNAINSVGVLVGRLIHKIGA